MSRSHLSSKRPSMNLHMIIGKYLYIAKIFTQRYLQKFTIDTVACSSPDIAKCSMLYSKQNVHNCFRSFGSRMEAAQPINNTRSYKVPRVHQVRKVRWRVVEENSKDGLTTCRWWTRCVSSVARENLVSVWFLLNVGRGTRWLECREESGPATVDYQVKNE